MTDDLLEDKIEKTFALLNEYLNVRYLSSKYLGPEPNSVKKSIATRKLAKVTYSLIGDYLHETT